MHIGVGLVGLGFSCGEGRNEGTNFRYQIKQPERRGQSLFACYTTSIANQRTARINHSSIVKPHRDCMNYPTKPYAMVKVMMDRIEMMVSADITMTGDLILR